MTPPASAIWPWLKQRFAATPITLDSSPQLDLGLNSFDWMSLTMELERAFRRAADRGRGRAGHVAARPAGRGRRAGEPGRPRGEIRELTPEQGALLPPQGWPLRALAAVLFGLNRLLMRGLFRVRVEGLEHLPAEGPYLLAPNHASYLDPFALAAALPWPQLQRLYWAGWTGLLFRGPLDPPVQPRDPGPAGRPRTRPDLDPAAGPRGPRARRAAGLVPRGRSARPMAGCIASCRASACCSSAPARRAVPVLIERHLRGLAAGAAPAAAPSGAGPLRRAARWSSSERGADGERHRRIADQLRDRVAALGDGTRRAQRPARLTAAASVV